MESKHNNVRQYIILRKDAKTVTGEPVSAQKLAVMASHASMAFLASMMRENCCEKDGKHHIEFDMDDEIYNGWLNSSFTKVLLAAKNLNDLKKAVERSKAIGLEEGKDFFCIRDRCWTELVPDEGEDTCFIAIGFKPMDFERTKEVTKKYQLYK